MKIIKYILVAVFVVFTVFVLVKNKGRESAVGNTEERAICYIWNTEAGDKATLKMVFTGEGGSQVSGYFNYLPAEKDRKVGEFSGTAGVLDQSSMSRTADLIWNSQAEGMTVQEELKVIFGDGIATVGFGEMKDRGDGVYIYANPDAISYSLNLQQTDCSDPAVK